MTQGPPCERGSSSLARRPLCRSLALGEARSQCRCENPSPQPPPRDGEGEQAKQYLFFSPSPLRGGGWGEGFSVVSVLARFAKIAVWGRKSSSETEPKSAATRVGRGENPWLPCGRKGQGSVTLNAPALCGRSRPGAPPAP